MKLFICLIVLGFSTFAFSAETQMACTKEGKVIEVKGDSVELKKIACEAEKGTWGEVKPVQKAGSGAGW